MIFLFRHPWLCKIALLHLCALQVRNLLLSFPDQKKHLWKMSSWHPQTLQIRELRDLLKYPVVAVHIHHHNSYKYLCVGVYI